MATPFLMMASTEPPRNRDNNLVSSYEQQHMMNRNKYSSSEIPVIKKHRPSSKSKATKSKSQAEKKAQRGMGIDKLERLRLEERLKKLNPVQFNQTQPGSLSSPVLTFGHNGNFNNSHDNGDDNEMNLEQFLMCNKRSDNGVFNGPGRVWDPRSGNVVENSENELSSIQKMQSVPDVCFKKKRVTAEDSGFTSEEIKNFCESSWNARNRHVDYPHGLNQYGNNSGFINNADHFRNVNRSTAFTRVCPNQNKEIRETHRNEGSSMGGGGNNILMEYDFLPSKNKSQFSAFRNIHEDFGVAAAETSNNDTSIDLSLRL